jgi:hypothetical protein
VTDAIATAIQGIPELVAQMGGNAANISAFHYEYGKDFRLAEAVTKMEPPSTLIAYSGRAFGKRDSMLMWTYQFKIFMRLANQAGSGSPISYEDLTYLLNGTNLFGTPVLTSGGAGYANSFQVPLVGNGSGGLLKATAVGGVIQSLTPLANGSGYDYAPTPNFSAGGGTGAAATIPWIARNLYSFEPYPNLFPDPPSDSHELDEDLQDYFMDTLTLVQIGD